MERKIPTNFFFILLLLVMYSACQGLFFEPDNWKQTIAGVGALSSPKAIDLNKDGVKDIVIGGGAKEFSSVQEAVIALDGKNGNILWTTPGRNQVVGSAIFQDINGDTTPDVFIGGRSAIFYAIDGTNGNILWEFLPDNDSTDYFNDSSILNFYTPQFVPDVDGDAIQDILTAYGGFIKATAQDLERPPGALMVLSGRTGEVLSKAYVPDGKEIYCSPIVEDFDQDGTLEVIFGTGGEYINGGLYRANLADVFKEDLSEATLLVDGNGKGFIAPPLIIDVNVDGVRDIVINSVDGRLIAINGKNNALLWTMQLEGKFDTYTMPAPGYFVGNDAIPDFFSSFGKGPWPDTKYTVHTLVDGKTGQLVFQDTLGTFQYASPVVMDFTNDGQDDVLLAVNTKVTSNLKGSNMRFLGTDLVIYPSGQGRPLLVEPTKLGSNLGSTPLLTDLDGDQYVDMIYSYMGDPLEFYSFKNLVIEKKELKLSTDRIKWGSYMGQKTDSKR